MKSKIAILFFIFAVSVTVLGAQQTYGGQNKGDPTIHADFFQGSEDRTLFSGHVEVSFEDYHIFADYLEYTPRTKKIIAKGRVTMSSKDTVITGEKLEFNLRDKTGEMYDSYGQIAPSVRYTTDRIDQVDDETLKFKKLNFTSCTQCVPRWKITCSKGRIKKEKYVEMTHMLFKIKNIPVFYIPYARYPVKKDGRSTGFLIPKFGTSNLRGFYLLNSFFWAIKPNVDLTLNFDYYSKAGLGFAEEFRYLFRNMDGNIKFYYFKYKEDNELGTTNTSDYLFKMKHKQQIAFLDTRISIDIDRQSDANFMKLFSNDFYSVLRRNSRSSVSINSKIWEFKLTMTGSVNETYFTFNNTSRSISQLPRIKLFLSQQKVWKLPGYFSLSTEYSSMSRKGKSYEAEETIYLTDVSSTRLNVTPIYTLNLVKFPWLGATVKLKSSFTHYFQTRDPEDPKLTVDDPMNINYQTAEATVKGPVFSKIFQFKRFKLKHVIEPKIVVRYATQVDDEDKDRLVTVNYNDYPTYSQAVMSLTTRLLYKKNAPNASALDLLSYTIKQSYFFDPLLASRGRQITIPITEDTVEKVVPEFSEMSHVLRFRPVQGFSLDATVKYNHYLDKFTRMRFAVNYRNRQSPVSGTFFYNRHLNQFASPDHIFNRDSIGGRLNVDIPGFPFKLKSIVNYDITDKEFRAGSFALTYDYQCIQLRSELRLYRFDGRVETQFNFGVSFGNLGMVKDFLGIDEK